MKAWIARRLEQYKRSASVISLGVQSVTLNGVIYGLIQSWGISPLWLLASVPTTVGAALSIGWLYYDVLKMRRWEKAAIINLDPTMQNELTPKERLILRLLLDYHMGDEKATARLYEAAESGIISVPEETQ